MPPLDDTLSYTFSPGASPKMPCGRISRTMMSSENATASRIGEEMRPALRTSTSPIISAPTKRTGNTADATDDGGDEGLQAGDDAHQVVDPVVSGGVEDTASARQTAGQREGGRDDHVHVDPHQSGGGLIVGGGPHGLADPGIPDDVLEHDQQDDRDGHDNEHRVGGSQVKMGTGQPGRQPDDGERYPLEPAEEHTELQQRVALPGLGPGISPVSHHLQNPIRDRGNGTYPPQDGQPGGGNHIGGQNEHLKGTGVCNVVVGKDEGQSAKVFQEKGNADGRDERGDAGHSPQGAVGEPFHRYGQQGAGQHGGQDHGDGADHRHCRRIHPGPDGQRPPVQVQKGDGEETDKGADHKDIAVGKVDQFHDAVDHRVAQGDQSINEAQLKAVQDLLGEDTGVRGRSATHDVEHQNPCQGEHGLAEPVQDHPVSPPEHPLFHPPGFYGYAHFTP